jgi:hypothetical protein
MWILRGILIVLLTIVAVSVVKSSPSTLAQWGSIAWILVFLGGLLGASFFPTSQIALALLVSLGAATYGSLAIVKGEFAFPSKRRAQPVAVIDRATEPELFWSCVSITLLVSLGAIAYAVGAKRRDAQQRAPADGPRFARRR